MNKMTTYIGINVLGGMLIFLLLISCGSRTGNQGSTSNEEVSSTSSWAVRMVESEMKRHPEAWSLDFEKAPKWNYTHGLVLTAIERVWKQTGDARYFDYIKAYADEMIDENGNIGHNYKIENYNIDHIKPGMILFNLYDETEDARYLQALKTLRTQLKQHPRTEEGGYWHKNRYPHQMWLDGLYMGAPFYARYGMVFNEPENFDDVIHQITLMEQKARDPETGLLYHGWDESRSQFWADPETGLSASFWGRAIGWYAMALVDVLDYIPEDHPQRYKVIEVLDRLAEAVTKYQDPESGVWYQVIDQVGREGNYLESSVSSMLVYSLAKGANRGYIDTKYLDVAKKGYEGILEQFIEVDEDGEIHITQGCAVAGLGAGEHRDGTYKYYLSEPVRSDDPKATGPFIKASLELNR
jgi:unsaturated rhamnogalacturonyl hydrolase